MKTIGSIFKRNKSKNRSSRDEESVLDLDQIGELDYTLLQGS